MTILHSAVFSILTRIYGKIQNLIFFILELPNVKLNIFGGKKLENEENVLLEHPVVDSKNRFLVWQKKNIDKTVENAAVNGIFHVLVRLHFLDGNSSLVV